MMAKATRSTVQASPEIQGFKAASFIRRHTVVPGLSEKETAGRIEQHMPMTFAAHDGKSQCAVDSITVDGTLCRRDEEITSTRTH
jgi:hypothetical protein